MVKVVLLRRYQLPLEKKLVTVTEIPPCLWKPVLPSLLPRRNRRHQLQALRLTLSTTAEILPHGHRHMLLAMDDIPTTHNLLAAFFNWIYHAFSSNVDKLEGFDH